METIHNIEYEKPTFPPHLSPDAVNFISSALSKNPISRPTVQQMLAHPWIVQQLQPEAGHGGTSYGSGPQHQQKHQQPQQQQFDPVSTLIRRGSSNDQEGP